jgi:hypothetical protein
LLQSTCCFFIFYESFFFFWFIFYFVFSKKLSNNVVWLFSISSIKVVFNFFTLLSKPLFFIFLSLRIYKISNSVILTFVFIFYFLFCSIKIIVFSLIHGFIGVLFNFPNVSLAAVAIACFKISHFWLVSVVSVSIVQILFYPIIVFLYFPFFL